MKAGEHKMVSQDENIKKEIYLVQIVKDWTYYFESFKEDIRKKSDSRKVWTLEVTKLKTKGGINKGDSASSQDDHGSMDAYYNQIQVKN